MAYVFLSGMQAIFRKLWNTIETQWLNGTIVYYTDMRIFSSLYETHNKSIYRKNNFSYRLIHFNYYMVKITVHLVKKIESVERIKEKRNSQSLKESYRYVTKRSSKFRTDIWNIQINTKTNILALPNQSGYFWSRVAFFN